MSASPNATVSARRPEHNPLNIFKKCAAESRPAFICGPMVRYSKLPFRELVRHFKADIVYTPMILAREFVRNDIARLSDFTTNEDDRCVIVQVGANNETDLLRFVEMIHPYVDAIGLNCGCPIKEQVREGIGAALMTEPEKVARMVQAVKEKYGSKVLIETKIRIHKDLNETVRFVQMVEAAGVDWITVHGRTKTTRSSQPADFEAIRLVKESVSCPVVANGDCFSLADAYEIGEKTGCDGVMAVRGILANPSMFAGYDKTTWGAVEVFWDLASAYGLPFRITQHHLSVMLEKVLKREVVKQMNDTKSLVELIDWFDDNFELRRRGEARFGESVEPAWRVRREEMARI
ncbi:hypothetical protein BABINDRAFT_170040 [Babjeviella inositovora NRRL Y-12698]|uniref:tRNA-dihydrouridine synthase n=1 Tax=Babjeviella inositovora NRRL Y-12698 TaxID=984486 RepID=A0A1E3QZ67_9ASCO|nr:uncharacterized protein BABINDRAFT_170040 [Babjeviella inositovora NRRL Y-12698]ODQ82926.1 hypothetical protein BABINDRAFT_170040 [Babjeviella inositovora NRRL Y-12698]